MTESTILVGVDDSAEAAHALDWAVAYAGRTGAALHVVSSYALPGFFLPFDEDGKRIVPDDVRVRTAVERTLAHAAARAERAGATVTTEVATGDPTGVLVERSGDHALAVVGSRGHGGFAERLLGTVSATLPAYSRCPTVVVPFRQESEPLVPDDDASTDEVRRYGRVVVGVDGSSAWTGRRARTPRCGSRPRSPVPWTPSCSSCTRYPRTAGVSCRGRPPVRTATPCSRPPRTSWRRPSRRCARTPPT
ncbi:hypothetical protein GCM10023216_15100 [Isoptericola chiayiensis]|uniref:UspA domain-containing protein n=1 Tax=Isoptericola chiayiensis TaxID=579446 RepID=A0ABP8YE09_9MICO|nr:nucleotide-binding universal stress UspA family protein [Isoptericola chiayiensis]